MTTPTDPPLFERNAAESTVFRTLTPIGATERKPLNYPVSALPERLAKTVRAITVVADCHPNTAAWAVFGAASAVAQTCAVVETLAGPARPVPLSLYTHLIAHSGARKSTAFSAAWDGIIDADNRLQKAHIEKKAQAGNSKAKPGDSDYLPHRAAGTIRQVITEPTMEALIRDMEIGNPFPVLASAEGAAFFRGYASGGDGNSRRATQTASILSTAYSGETINIARVGSDGKSPNRAVAARQYALGMHYAVQDASLGQGMLYAGQDAEFGMSARSLLSETPQRDILAFSDYSPEQRRQAEADIADWNRHCQAIRALTDGAILTSERGAPPRAVIEMTDVARSTVIDIINQLANLVKNDTDKSILERAGEQVIRIAATLQIGNEGAPSIGTRLPLARAYLDSAYPIMRYHWRQRQRIALASQANDLDEACQSIIKIALKWMVSGKANKRNYNPDDTTWGWAALLKQGKHTSPSGRYGQDSEFKLKCKDRLIACGIMAEAGRRVTLNPEYLYEQKIW